MEPLEKVNSKLPPVVVTADGALVARIVPVDEYTIILQFCVL